MRKRSQNQFTANDEKSNDQTIKQINEMYATGVVEEMDEWTNQEKQDIFND